MRPEDVSYIKLRKHLNQQPVGLPATRSGVEIRLLKHIFSPDEAELATCLSHKPEPLEAIHRKAGHLVDSVDTLAQKLDRIQHKGGIESKMIQGQKHYNNIPLVVGMYEMQLGRLTPEFLRDFDRYTAKVNFGLEFLSTRLPQLRTIPVSKSIQPRHRAASYDEVSAIVAHAGAPFAVVECICRKKREMEGHPCRVTRRRHTCLTLGSVAALVMENGIGREISRQEAGDILERNQKEGLVIQPANAEEVEFVCSCCGCCCGLLRMHRMLPRPQDFWATNFYAVVDAHLCDGCGACVQRCQVNAVRLSPGEQTAGVDRHRCLGCGVCVHTCPAQAISLEKKALAVKPPQTREALYDVIMANKKGPLGKFKLAGKLFLDALRNGHSHLLKKFPVGDRTR